MEVPSSAGDEDLLGSRHSIALEWETGALRERLPYSASLAIHSSLRLSRFVNSRGAMDGGEGLPTAP